MKHVLIIGLLLTAVSLADSLLPKAPQDLYAPEAIKVGSLVTVIINDNVRTIQTVQIQSEADSGPTGPLVTLLSAVTGFSPSHKDETERTEIANTQSQFSQTITATVTEVKGDVLALEAKRSIKLDGRARHLVFHGKVRRRDIGTDNKVDSELVADANIVVDGLHTSPVSPGILTRVLRVLF